MCGRYFIDDGYDPEISGIIGQISDRYRDTPELAAMKRGEIFPSDIVPVITQRASELMKWGFRRLDGKGRIINARLETAAEKPMFRKPFYSNRCIIPANHYFEWKKDEAKKLKFAIGHDGPVYMAGLYRQENDEDMPLFVILTKPAEISIMFIHDRMPVILNKSLLRAWLGGNCGAEDLMRQNQEDLKYAAV